MTTFQWGKAKPITDGEGKFSGDQVQIVVCLDCYDWCNSTPTDCRLWMIDHSEKSHPKTLTFQEEMNVGSYDRSYDYQ